MSEQDNPNRFWSSVPPRVRSEYTFASGYNANGARFDVEHEITLGSGWRASFDRGWGYRLPEDWRAGNIGHAGILLATLITPGNQRLDIIDADNAVSVVLPGSYTNESQQVTLHPNEPPTTIGRAQNTDIVVEDALASRVHAQIGLRNDRISVADTSKNGTALLLPVPTPYDVTPIPMRDFGAIDNEQAESRLEYAPKIHAAVAEWTYRQEAPSQDSHFIMPKEKAFGVLDGVGGVKFGGEAAHDAATYLQHRAIADQPNQYKPDQALDWLIQSVNAASVAAYEQYGGHGSTTATSCIIVEDDGKMYAPWLSVGDSRLYLVRDRIAHQVSQDEGVENEISNWLGGYDRAPVRQYGILELQSGDRLVMVTDGVTGDRGTDIMHDDEIAFHINRFPDNSAAAAQELVRAANKLDDRTAIVININFT